MGMEILFMTFMVIVSIMALFAVMVVLRDVVREVFDARREKYAAEAAKRAELQSANALAEQICAQAVEPQAEPVPQPVEEPVEEPEAPAEPEAAPAEENDDGTIKFATGQQQTLDEKYLALSAEARGWYDEIIKYASAVEGSKRFKTARYEDYKVGKNRLVRMLIKRGVIQCEFNLQNSDFKNYVNENKIAVKQSSTVMYIEEAATVEAAKNSIDIVVAAIAEEKEYKKQQARERRKAAKAAASEEAAAN
jgi:hypothetical protein